MADAEVSDIDIESIERLGRQLVGNWYARSPDESKNRDEYVAPYAMRFRPSVREQLNPLRRRHPEWPTEWYVRVPGSTVTWNPRDLEVWGLDGKPLFKAFPDRREAEEYAQSLWRRVWGSKRVGKDAVIEVTRERVFPVDMRRVGEYEQLTRWLSSHGGERIPQGVVVVYRNTEVGFPSGSLSRPDLEREEERLHWLSERSSPEAKQRTNASKYDVHFDESELARAGPGTFVTEARRIWRQAKSLAQGDSRAKTACASLQAAVIAATRNLDADVRDAREVNGGPGRGRAVEREPWEFVNAVERAQEIAARELVFDPPLQGEWRVVARDLRLDVDRWGDHALAFRSRSVGLYNAGLLDDAVVDSLRDGGYQSIAVDHRPEGADDRRIVAATRLPAGRFIKWEARTTDLLGGLHPVSVSKPLFNSLDEVREAADGLPVTVVDSKEAVERWKAKVRNPRLADYATREPDGHAPVKVPEPAPKAPEDRWHFGIAPFGGGRAVLFASDGWGVEDKPLLVTENPDTRALVPLRKGGSSQPVILSGGSFADLVAEAQARWPEAKVEAADLPRSVAHTLAKRHAEEPKRVSPSDTLWHVAPVGDRPGVAMAWTYQIAGGADDFRLQPVPLVRQDKSLVRFTGESAREAVRAGYEYMAERGLAADATRRMPRSLLEVAARERIRLEAAHIRERELRPEEPFEVFSALSGRERRKALDAVPEDARSVVEAASFGLMPREIAPQRGLAVEEVSRQYRTAERALADHFVARPELAEPKVEPARMVRPKLGL